MLNKKFEIIYRYDKITRPLKDTITGEFNRICVTDDKNELNKMVVLIKDNIDKLAQLKLKEIEELEQ